MGNISYKLKYIDGFFIQNSEALLDKNIDIKYVKSFIFKF